MGEKFDACFDETLNTFMGRPLPSEIEGGDPLVLEGSFYTTDDAASEVVSGLDTEAKLAIVRELIAEDSTLYDVDGVAEFGYKPMTFKAIIDRALEVALITKADSLPEVDERQRQHMAALEEFDFSKTQGI